MGNYNKHKIQTSINKGFIINSIVCYYKSKEKLILDLSSDTDGGLLLFWN